MKKNLLILLLLPITVFGQLREKVEFKIDNTNPIATQLLKRLSNER